MIEIDVNVVDAVEVEKKCGGRWLVEVIMCAASLLAHNPHTLTEGTDNGVGGRCARSLCARARRATPEESPARGASSARGREAR